MDHTGKDHGMGAKPSAVAQAVDHSTMAGMTAAPDQPRTPIPALTDADRAAAFPVLAQPMEHASRVNRYVLFDQLEWQGANGGAQAWDAKGWRSEEHTSELQSLMRISYAVFCLKKKTKQ